MRSNTVFAVLAAHWAAHSSLRGTLMSSDQIDNQDRFITDKELINDVTHNQDAPA
jgi:hypothetical protein